MHIRIPNLPQEARDMLEFMWNCETQSEILEFRRSLSPEQYRLSETCELLLWQAVLDDMIEDVQDFTGHEVEEVLAKYRTNN